MTEILDTIKQDAETLIELNKNYKAMLNEKSLLEGKKKIQKLEKKELERLAELEKRIADSKEYSLKLVAHIQKSIGEGKITYQ